MNFHEWFKKQSHREDAVGWAAKWFLHKGQGRYPKEPLAFDGWLEIISAKAGKPHKLAAKGAFITAWKEFRKEEDKSKTSDGEMIVRSTIARIRTVVKGSHERGELEEEEELSVARFFGPVATVGVRQRLTTSYGGDWVQLGVMLSIPCYPEEIQDAFEFADDWVTDKIRAEVEKFKGGGPLDPSVGSSDGSHDEEKDQTDQEPEDGDKNDEKETFKLEPDSENDNPPALEPNNDTCGGNFGI